LSLIALICCTCNTAKTQNICHYGDNKKVKPAGEFALFIKPAEYPLKAFYLSYCYGLFYTAYMNAGCLNFLSSNESKHKFGWEREAKSGTATAHSMA
jgi:hypothetical protein